MFSLQIALNGEPHIARTTTGIGGYTYHRNDGLDFSPRAYLGETVESIAAQVREAAPTARVRVLRDRVRVRYPVDMMEMHEALLTEWRDLAAAGSSFADLRNAMLSRMSA